MNYAKRLSDGMWFERTKDNGWRGEDGKAAKLKASVKKTAFFKDLDAAKAAGYKPAARTPVATPIKDPTIPSPKSAP